MPYLNVDEVESALETESLSYPALCTLIQLPNVSCEGRTSHAIRVHVGPRVNRHGLLLLGGVHAREWGSSDILISLVEGLLQAYTTGTGLTFGNKVYSAADVVTALENADLFVFPDVNPDGKHYSQVTYSMWRTNRCPIPGTTAIGTDLNRNFDFLWACRKRSSWLIHVSWYRAVLRARDQERQIRFGFVSSDTSLGRCPQLPRAAALPMGRRRRSDCGSNDEFPESGLE